MHVTSKRLSSLVMNHLNKKSNQLKVKVLHLVRSQKRKENLKLKVEAQGEKCLWGKVYVCIMLYDIISNRRKENRKGSLTFPGSWLGKWNLVCSFVSGSPVISWSFLQTVNLLPVPPAELRSQIRAATPGLLAENGGLANVLPGLASNRDPPKSLPTD
jgi:hypothetical protein